MIKKSWIYVVITSYILFFSIPPDLLWLTRSLLPWDNTGLIVLIFGAICVTFIQALGLFFIATTSTSEFIRPAMAIGAVLTKVLCFNPIVFAGAHWLNSTLYSTQRYSQADLISKVQMTTSSVSTLAFALFFCIVVYRTLNPKPAFLPVEDDS